MSDHHRDNSVQGAPGSLKVELGTAVLTLDDPRTRNSLSNQMIDLIVESIDRVNADATAKCLVVTGAGTTFCSGGNMKEMFSPDAFTQGSSEEIRRSLENYQRVVRALQDLSVPSIAALNGPAAGGGLDLALACDIRLASENAQLISRFLSLGLVSADGGWWLLPRIVGLSRAYEIALQDKPIDSGRALEIGLVSAVFSAAEFMPKVMEFAAEISKHPALAIRLAKRLIQQSAQSDLATSLELATTMQEELYRTEDHRKALAAFAQRRRAK